MIEKILDKYFAKKTCLLIREKLAFVRIDFKIEKKSDKYNIYIKNLREKDIYYKLFLSIKFDEGLERYIAIMQEDRKSLYEVAKNILEN